jgi:hypothetical protein
MRQLAAALFSCALLSAALLAGPAPEAHAQGYDVSGQAVVPTRLPGGPVRLRDALERQGGRPGVLRRARLRHLARGDSHRIRNGDPLLDLLRGRR